MHFVTSKSLIVKIQRYLSKGKILFINLNNMFFYISHNIVFQRHFVFHSKVTLKNFNCLHLTSSYFCILSYFVLVHSPGNLSLYWFNSSAIKWMNKHFHNEKKLKFNSYIVGWHWYRITAQNKVTELYENYEWFINIQIFID